MRTPSLFDTAPRFDGRTFDPVFDQARTTQLGRVYELMRDGEWRTLIEIESAVGGSGTGVSARLWDLRKQKFGGYQVNRRRRGTRGTLEYRLLGARMIAKGNDVA